MNYLIKFYLILFLFISKSNFANENKIIFEVNKNIYTELDLKNRIKYLEILNSSKFNSNLEEELRNDFLSSTVFFEYVKNNKILNKILDEKKINFLTQTDYEYLLNELNQEVINNNINYDLSRKIVIEEFLQNYKEYIFDDQNDIKFIYNYKIKYLTIPNENLTFNNDFENILNSKDVNKIIEFLNNENYKFYLQEKQIQDINKANNKIKNLINTNNKFVLEKNKSFLRITYINKNLDLIDGIYYRLINIETKNILNENENNCDFIKSLNIKSSNEYEYKLLNDNIKNSLKSINDFIIFKNNDSFNYIFLCEIKVNQDFLKELSINKKINVLAKNIEFDFLNKYSKIYKVKEYYE